MKFRNVVSKWLGRFLPPVKISPVIDFVFDEKYSISTEEMIRLIEQVSDSDCWAKEFRKGVDPLVSAMQMTRTNGAQINSDILHVGYCRHDVEQVIAYLIRDKQKDKTLFSARKYDWESEVEVMSFSPGNWIEYLYAFKKKSPKDSS